MHQDVASAFLLHLLSKGESILELRNSTLWTEKGSLSLLNAFHLRKISLLLSLSLSLHRLPQRLHAKLQKDFPSESWRKKVLFLPFSFSPQGDFFPTKKISPTIFQQRKNFPFSYYLHKFYAFVDWQVGGWGEKEIMFWKVLVCLCHVIIIIKSRKWKRKMKIENLQNNNNKPKNFN